MNTSLGTEIEFEAGYALNLRFCMVLHPRYVSSDRDTRGCGVSSRKYCKPRNTPEPYHDCRHVKPNLERCWTWLGVSTAAVRRNEHFLLYHELDNTEVITQEIGLKA